MNIKTLEELENQAWNLRVKLNRIIEAVNVLERRQSPRHQSGKND